MIVVWQRNRQRLVCDNWKNRGKKKTRLRDENAPAHFCVTSLCRCHNKRPEKCVSSLFSAFFFPFCLDRTRYWVWALQSWFLCVCPGCRFSCPPTISTILFIRHLNRRYFYSGSSGHSWNTRSNFLRGEKQHVVLQKPHCRSCTANNQKLWFRDKRFVNLQKSYLFVWMISQQKTHTKDEKYYTWYIS